MAAIYMCGDLDITQGINHDQSRPTEPRHAGCLPDPAKPDAQAAERHAPRSHRSRGLGGDMRYFSIENIALGEDDYGLPIVGPALTEVEGSPEVEKAANATALTPQQKEALLALSLHMQNGLNGELLEEIRRDEALEVVKLAFSAVSSKHRSTRAREAIDALMEVGKLQQKESGMLTIGS